jgi:hypothetical protein
MRKTLYRKEFVIGIIFLFIGIALAPGITATIHSSDSTSTKISENKDIKNDLVEVIVQVGNNDHKVMLTPDQALELESLIDRTKTWLDAATTMEEASRIFDETVVSLYKMGMLPEETSVQEAQRLVNGYNRLPRIGRKLDDLGGSDLDFFDDQTNAFCLIMGDGSNSGINFYGPPVYTFLLISSLYNYNFFNLSRYGILNKILGGFGELFVLITTFLNWANPISLGAVIGLGKKSGSGSNSFYESVNTIGLSGVKKWEDKMYGNLGRLNFCEYHLYYPGVLGFTGIKIIGMNQYCSFLGAAMLVRIGSEPPDHMQ